MIFLKVLILSYKSNFYLGLVFIQKLLLDDCLSKYLSAIDSTKSKLTDSD